MCMISRRQCELFVVLQRQVELQALFDPCACTSQDEYCTTELCLSVDKLKKKTKQTTGKTAAGKILCKCTDVNVYVVHNLSHVEAERTYTPAQLQTLVKSCQLSSSVFLVRTTISHIHVRTTISHIQKALVPISSRVLVYAIRQDVS